MRTGAANRQATPWPVMAGVVAAGVLVAANARADAPNVAQQLSRAIAYENGEGVPKDQLLAAALYCEAARDGSAEAAYRLGWMYANGRGVPHDDARAAALMRIAANRGDAFAKRTLDLIGNVPGMLPDCFRLPEPPMPLGADDLASLDDDGVDPFANLPPYKRKIAELVKSLAPRYGIEPRLALAVIAVESNFDAAARSVKNAQGLMQLIPETAARFNVRNVFDVNDNLRGGLAYLRWLLAYYRGEVKLAVAAYNAGEGAVDRYRGVPPFPETRDYVRRIVRLFRSDFHPYDPSVVEASAIAAPLQPAARVSSRPVAGRR
jgi:soluble lytic murein transglycosylase-like protein